MAISTELKKAIEAKDLSYTRTILKNSMREDPTFETFDEMARYAEGFFPELYDVDDGTSYSEEMDSWDEAFTSDLAGDLLGNFSKEKINFMRRVYPIVFAKTVEEIRTRRENASASASNMRSPNTAKQAAPYITAAGGLALVAGVAASETALIVTGAVVAAAGGIMWITTKDK